MPLERFRPIYKITIKNVDNDREYEFNSWYVSIKGKKEKSLNKLTIYIDRDLNVPLDLFRIRIATKSGSLLHAEQNVLRAGDIKTGAKVKIYLGYASDSDDDVKLGDMKNLVFTGLVDDVSQDFKNIVITGYSNAYKIIFKKPEAFKEKDLKGMGSLTSDKIVKALIKEMVEPDPKNFDKGMELSQYTPNTKESIYNNIKLLSEYNGYDLYMSKEGKLRFCMKNSERRVKLWYARDIIDNSITIARPPYDTVKVYVCSTITNSDDADAWQISSKPLEGAESIGNNKVEVLQRQSAIFKSGKEAKEAAKNKLAKLYTPESGLVTVLGNPGVELGQSLSIIFTYKDTRKNIPGVQELDYMEREDVKITRITHKFNMRSGFVTILGWIKPPELSSAVPKQAGLVGKPKKISESLKFGVED